MKQVKEMTISENKKRGTKMIVVHTVVKGKENRCKKPFIISETKHVKRGSGKFVTEQELTDMLDDKKGYLRDPNIQRSSTVHYPDWDKKKKEYVVPPNQRKG